MKRINYSGISKEFFKKNFKIFSSEGKFILLVIPTSKIYSIDKPTEDFIMKIRSSSSVENAIKELLNNYEENEIKEILNEIKQVVKIAKDIKPEYKGEITINSLSLFISQSCNLSCIYCYGNKGTYNESNVKFMNFTTAKAAVDFLIKKRDPKNKHIAIVFFGGEPLLNKKLIFKIVKYTNKKCAENNLIPHYSISTNCTLIHGDKQLIDLIRENNFSLCISIDGPPQIHNVNRPFKNEKGSYREVQKGINYLHEEKIHRLRARATYVIGNGHLRDIVFHLNKMGFDRVYVEEVSNLTDKRFSDITNFNYLESEYNKLFSEYKKNILNKKTYAFKVSYFDEILRMIHKGGVKFYYCGAGRTFLSVSSKGEFYPCHRFVGNEDMKVGNVFTGLNEEKLREFINRICVSNRKSCLKCWVRFLCAGGCAYENFVESGSIDGLDILNCIKRRFLLRKFILLYSSLPKEIKDNL